MVKALVLFHSQEFGNTSLMADAVAEGLRSEGCEVDVFNTNDGRYDVTQFPKYDCVAIGTPDYFSYIAGTLKTFMDDFYIHEVRKGLKGLKDKKYSVFLTHGGSGRARDALSIFKRVGTQVGNPVECRGKPGTDILEKCRALGKELANAVKP